MTRSELHGRRKSGSRRGRQGRKERKQWKALSSFMMILLVMVNLVVWLPLAFGYSYKLVVSDSMSPTIDKDALVVIKKTAPEQLKEGDIALYRTRVGTQNVLVLHRIQRIVASADNGLLFYSKGDANAKEDVNPVMAKQISGIHVAHIPYVGHWARLIHENLVVVLLVLAASLLTKISLDAANRKHSKEPVPVP